MDWRRVAVVLPFPQGPTWTPRCLSGGGWHTVQKQSEPSLLWLSGGSQNTAGRGSRDAGMAGCVLQTHTVPQAQPASMAQGPRVPLWLWFCGLSRICGSWGWHVLTTQHTLFPAEGCWHASWELRDFTNLGLSWIKEASIAASCDGKHHTFHLGMGTCGLQYLHKPP